VKIYGSKYTDINVLIKLNYYTIPQTATQTYSTTTTDSGALFTEVNQSGTTSTGTLTASSGSVDTTTLGTYTLTFTKTDAAGNVATPVTRTVVVTDQTPPTITLTGPATMTLTQGTVFIDPGANCTDNIDLTCVVTISGSVNTTQTGSYILTYRAVDTAGNIAILRTRTVTVVAAPDTTAPIITLSGSAAITLTQ
jgi:hypothetical protein